MILCHCAGVSDSIVERLIADGAETLSEISRSCGAGRHCAPCRTEIRAMLSRAGSPALYSRASVEALAIAAD